MSGCATKGCAGCPIGAASAVRAEPLGEQGGRWDHVIALAGNPNTGKSTIFNALTGLRQHTGNWPGKTIARAEGGFSYAGQRYRIVDLPGTYSLLSATQDEEVARDFILFGRPSAAIVVLDATRLERNLNLALQVLQIADRVVVCVNLMDEARAHGIEVDCPGLAHELGVPVVAAAARQGEGIGELLRELNEVANGRTVCRPRRLRYDIPGLDRAVEELGYLLGRAFPNVPHAPWIAMRLLEGDRRIVDAVKSGELGRLADDPVSTGTERAT